MAVNRFNQPAQAKFVDTYVPVPFEEMGNMLKARQQRLDQNLGALDQARVAADNLAAIPNSADAEYISGVRDKINDLSMNYLDKDLSDPEIYRELNREMRSSINPERVRKIQESYAGYENYTKEAARLESLGRGVHPSLRFDPTGYNSVERGVFTELPTAGQDWEAAAREVFQDMDMEEMGTRAVAGAPGYRQTIHAITEARVAEHADQRLPGFLATPAGREMTKVAERTGQDPIEMAKNFLQAQGREFIASRQGQPFNAWANLDTTAPQTLDVPASDYGPNTPLANMDQRRGQIKRNTPTLDEVIPNLDYNKPKKELRREKREAVSALWRGYEDRIDKADSREERKRLRDEAWEKSSKLEDEYTERINSIDDDKQLDTSKLSEDELDNFNALNNATAAYYNIQDFQNLSQEDQIDKINEYIDYRWNKKERYPKVTSYLSSGRPEEMKKHKIQQDAINEVLFTNRPVYVPELGIEQNLQTVSAWLDEYPVSGDNPYSWYMIGETEDLGRAEMPRAKQIEVRDSKGQKVDEFFIGGSEEENVVSHHDNLVAREMGYSLYPFGEFEIGDATIKWREVEGAANTQGSFFVSIDSPERNIQKVPLQDIGQVRQFLKEIGVY